MILNNDVLYILCWTRSVVRLYFKVKELPGAGRGQFWGRRAIENASKPLNVVQWVIQHSMSLF